MRRTPAHRSLILSSSFSCAAKQPGHELTITRDHVRVLLGKQKMSPSRHCCLHGAVLAVDDSPLLVPNTASAPLYFTDAGDGLINIVIDEAFRCVGLRFKIVPLSGERIL